MTENDVVVSNRRAKRDYEILHTLEAGIELKGTEIKSLRDRQASLNDSFARIEKGEIYLYNFQVSPYKFGNIHNVDPMRVKKLLLHKSEISSLFTKAQLKGHTLIPLSVYFKKGYAKVELAVAKGKKLHDRREEIKEREAKRDMDRAKRIK